ncbi:aldehyde dehydrogenase family protein [Rhodococcus qingshengii]|uniref:aldehyde dehydrogenase family protein n=1 Tax=Rhodococcus qingshengii TaxID=334542 RepID=UPI001E51E972|nr:aldehyde dehydrogenase family protein [Rhodococcus qingshengii]MCD2135928.1 aldehyde dehydrogenase family protein [Rhodococcus qingshengii]
MTSTSTLVLDRDLQARTFLQLLNGELVAGASSQPVIDPATGESFAQSPVADAAQVDAAVAFAKAAFPMWRDTPVAERSNTVRAIADAIETRRDELARIIVLENGKPLESALADVDLAVTWARHVADASLTGTVLKDDAEAYIELRRKPIGVVAAIIPWNFPFFQMVYKVAPALVAGNTVVVKPAPTTPINAMVFGEILAELLPAGVVNIVGDAGEVGPHLTRHPDVGKVSFTGSTAAGRKVMASGAETLKRIVLELGGNDSAIVLEDADVTKVAAGIYSWAFMNTGQVCINIKRIYVPSSLYESFCEEFARHASAAVVGHGLDSGTDLGPIQNERQFDAVKGYLKLAHEDGTVIAGGHVLDRPGYFVEPTVVRDIDESSALIREETFGPIRSILRYDDLDDAIERANDTQYGLGNSVWGENVDAAAAVADRLESGTVWINTHFALDPGVPFGGRKQSGLGVEFGQEGLEEFTDPHVIHISHQ